MAIVFEQQRKPINWIKLLFWIFIGAFLVFAIYYLFFAPSPKIDVVLPAPLQKANQIVATQFVDPGLILNSQVFKSLKLYLGQPSVGVLGRANPFVSF